MKNPHKDESKVNPQREDGHRRIESNVFKSLIAAGLSKQQYQCVLLIIDQTWGYGDQTVQIPLSYFEDVLQACTRSIKNIIFQLEHKQIIYVNHHKRPLEIGFNKHYDTWQININVLDFIKNKISKVQKNALYDPSQGAKKCTTKVQKNAPYETSYPIIEKICFIEKGIESIERKNANSNISKLKKILGDLKIEFQDKDVKKLLEGRNAKDWEIINTHLREFGNKLGVEITWFNILMAAFHELTLREKTGRLKNWNRSLGLVFTGLFGYQKKNGKYTEPFLIVGIWEWRPQDISSFFGVSDVRTGETTDLDYGK